MNRSSYENAGLPPENVSKLRPATSQNCDVPHLNNETQTHSNNPLNEPLCDGPAEQGSLRTGDQAGYNVVRIPTLLNQPLRTPHVRIPTHAKAAETAAVKRIMATARLDQSLYERISSEASESMLIEAAQCEMKNPGTGIHALLHIMDNARHQKAKIGSS